MDTTKRRRAVIGIMVGIILAVAGCVAYRWGWHGLSLLGIAFFWCVILIGMPLHAYARRKERIAAMGIPVEPLGQKLIRVGGGILGILSGFVLMFLGLIPTAYIRAGLNPHDSTLIDILLYIPCAVPGFMVLAVGAGLLTVTREPKIETNFRQALSYLLRRTHAVGWLLLPIAVVAVALMVIIDKVRFHSYWYRYLNQDEAGVQSDADPL